MLMQYNTNTPISLPPFFSPLVLAFFLNTATLFFLADMVLTIRCKLSPSNNPLPDPLVVVGIQGGRK